MAHQSSNVTAFVTKLTPEPPEPVDTNPSDIQPPGIDEEPEYESLEEALTGG